MKKLLLFLMAYFFVTLSVDAEPIGRQQAQAIAQKFLTERGVAVSQLRSTARHLVKAKADGSQPYYVFNNGQNGGFVIVSGDDRAPSILGYSYTGAFGEEQVPENISSWLNSYVEQIEALKENGKAPLRANQNGMQQSRISISPLVISHWNQYAPYFNNTPTISDQQCLTGCVATAFAQVMKYYEWPKDYTTAVPGYSWNGQDLDELSPIKFDWDNMLYNYQGGLNANDGCSDSEDSQAAVATLMVYCGYSLEADYGTGETSASTSDIPYAMKNYFGYKGNIKSVNRSNFSSERGLSSLMVSPNGMTLSTTKSITIGLSSIAGATQAADTHLSATATERTAISISTGDGVACPTDIICCLSSSLASRGLVALIQDILKSS